MERKLPSPDNPRLGIKGASKKKKKIGITADIQKLYFYLFFFHTQQDEKNSATGTIKSRACRNTNGCKGKKKICDRQYGLKSASQSQ